MKKRILLAVVLLFLVQCSVFGVQCFAQQSTREREALFVARKAFDDGFYDVTQGLLERFIKDYPDSSVIAQAQLLIGRCYFHQNKFLDALSVFEGLLDKPYAKEIKDELLYWVAEVHFRGNAFEKASEYYKMIVDEHPDSAFAPLSYFSLGWCLYQQQQYRQALGYFEIMEKRFPHELQARDSSFKIIECRYNLKDYSGLRDKVKSYLKVYAKDTAHLAYLYFYLAEAEYYLNNFNDSIAGYSKALEASSDEQINVLSRLGIGWSCLKQKKYKEAQDAFAAVAQDSCDAKNMEILLLGKAILFFETSRFSESKAVNEELLKTTQDPVVMIQAYLGKADCLYNLAEYKEAINIYKEALTKSVSAQVPREICDKLHYGLAWSYLKEGEFKTAIDEFQKLARDTQDQIVKLSALCQVGDTYQDSGNYTMAAQTYDNILKNYPDSLYADYVQYQLGFTMLKSSNFDAAILSFMTLKKNFPASKLIDDAVYALGLVYFQKEDYESAREIFEKFQSEYKSSSLRAQGLYLLGASFYNLGKYADAIETFKNIIRTNTAEGEIIQKCEYEIADCYYQMGNEKEAMTRFKVMRSRYPDSSLAAEVIWWLGQYYYRNNNFVLARGYFSSLVKDFPQSNLVASCYYVLGSTYEEESRYQDAIENFKKVLELDKTDLSGTAAIAIADIYVRQGKNDPAIVMYDQVAQKHSNLLHLVYPKIAAVYRSMDNYDKALQLYQKSLDIVPARQMADIQFKIAETRQAQKNVREAIEEYLKVTYLYSENPELSIKALLRVAAIYEDGENYKEAVNIYKKIISMNTQEAKYAQERIDLIKANMK